MIRMVKDEEFSHVKHMWKVCFNEEDKFLDFYFQRKYKTEYTIVAFDGNEMTASLQMLPYDMTFCGEIVKTAYISGAATMPQWRKKGIMSKLLCQSFFEMRKNKQTFSTLIPAEEWLFKFYENSGYTTCFDKNYQDIKINDIIPPIGHIVRELDNDTMLPAYSFYRDIMLAKQCAVLKTTEDFSCVVDEHRLWDGKILVAMRNDTVSGICFSIVYNDKLVIKELLFSNEDSKSALLSELNTIYACESATIITAEQQAANTDKFAMARVIDVYKALSDFAKTSKEAAFSIKVNDFCLPFNSGIYCVGGGSCKKIKASNFDYEADIPLLTRLLMGYRTAELGELAKIFPQKKPYINMMLN